MKFQLHVEQLNVRLVPSATAIAPPGAPPAVPAPVAGEPDCVTDLRNHIADLQAERQRLVDENTALQRDIDDMTQENATAIAEQDRLIAQAEAARQAGDEDGALRLVEQVQRLQAAVGQNLQEMIDYRRQIIANNARIREMINKSRPTVPRSGPSWTRSPPTLLRTREDTSHSQEMNRHAAPDSQPPAGRRVQSLRHPRLNFARGHAPRVPDQTRLGPRHH